ncbi:IclR family transcriptional regulator domain-containing protein [Halobellus sp. GM3]|uniref:IclR family transcriptional regulator domain-containing protein n=1 Tax=Halobellus sp. GM3 TaxID=3458410 RepID=UPI00403DAF71
MQQPTGDTIKSDETLLEILEALYELDVPTLTSIADQVGVSKSTVHRHLETLRTQRFVSKQNDQYVLGLEFLRFGGAARERYPFHRQSKSIVQQVAHQTGEFVGFLVEEQGVGTFIYCEMGPEGVPSDAKVGQNLLLNQSASGKAILAHLPEDRRTAILDEYGLPPRTQQTLTEREALLEDLEGIRERGYAYAHEEYTDGLRAIAAPAFDAEDEVIGSLVVAGPIHRMRGERFESDLPELVTGAVKEFELTVSYA